MYKISFIFNDNDVEFSNDRLKELYTDILDWLYNNGYDFSGPTHSTFNRRILSLSEVKSLLTKYQMSHFYNIGNSGKYILYNDVSVGKILPNILKMLENFGVDKIKTEGFNTKSFKIKPFKEFDDDNDSGPELEHIEEESTKNCYVVRAGRGNEDISLFINGNFVGIGYNTNNFDVSKHSKQEINSFLMDSIYDVKSVPQYLSQIELFKSIKEGDIILSPDINSVHVGVASSEIYLVQDKYPNRIDVEWFSEIEKNSKVNIPKTVFMIKGFDFENFDFKTDTVVEDDDVELIKKLTFLEAAQIILKQNDNQPMSAREIWDEIEEQDLVETSGATPWASLLTIMLKSSDNGNVSKKYRTKLFHIVSDNPAMFILINPDQEVQSVEDEDLELPTRPIAFTLPEEDITSFSHFRGIQSQEEREKPFSVEPGDPVENPFRQAVCVLGKSGKGKSTTIEKILDNFGDEMEHEFIIPTSSTTNLLSQYSPKSNEYTQSRLGKLIMKAHNNPSKMYTAVFDECHKSNVIEMINDELLQCISLYRNMGNRFISLDDDTASLYKGLKTRGGNLLLPDNFGFIFLSSKPDVIISNSDFFNRVNIYVLTKQPRGIEDISFDNTEYFAQIGDPETGKKTLEDIDRIRELNDAD